MKVTATVMNREGLHQTSVSTDGEGKNIEIASRATGFGSNVSGGELLYLALATCYCNDIYREAASRGIVVSEVVVQADGEFGGPGDPARRVTYRAKVTADAPGGDIEALMKHTDSVAEIQNSLRNAIPVQLTTIEAISRRGNAG